MKGLVYGSCAEGCVWHSRGDKLKESPGRFRCTWGGRSCSWLLFHSRRASRCEARTSWHTGSPTRTEGSRKTQTCYSERVYLFIFECGNSCKKNYELSHLSGRIFIFYSVICAQKLHYFANSYSIYLTERRRWIILQRCNYMPSITSSWACRKQADLFCVRRQEDWKLFAAFQFPSLS